MNAWVLIAVMSLQGGVLPPTTIITEFNTEAACLDAKARIIYEANHHGFDTMRRMMVCVPKGEAK